MAEYPILDNHVHLQSDGRNVEAVRDFEKAGGTHIILSHMPYHSVNINSGQDFLKEYEITLDMVEKVRGQTDTKIWATLGPYPVRLIRLEERYGLEKATEVAITVNPAVETNLQAGLARPELPAIVSSREH